MEKMKALLNKSPRIRRSLDDDSKGKRKEDEQQGGTSPPKWKSDSGSGFARSPKSSPPVVEMISGEAPWRTGSQPSFVKTAVEVSSKTTPLGTRVWLRVQLESFGSIGLVYYTGGPKNGVMLNFKDISLVRVENKQIFALVIGGSELWVRRQDSPVLALQVSEWVRFATGRRVEEILKMENVSEAKKVNTKLVKTLERKPRTARSSSSDLFRRSSNAGSSSGRNSTDSDGERMSMRESGADGDHVSGEGFEIPEIGNFNSLSLHAGNDCEELFVSQGGSIIHFNPDGEEDAASSLMTELMQLSGEVNVESVVEEAESGDPDAVVVCWSCNELYAASLPECSHCGEGQL